ncbi:hypothetical protein K503DRAFT_155340 [Rhizopogon vinicolor AM-OR11-026]|uniref:Uncharacterized protein n=1 Tax=Rhizopogon vinicolor AM-OR11-026 TaxID=1314800 RepID=A0A1B7NEU5_9AGAM|nr:hypothetical protein K503DRAFT_155340 [Rhizopogon vinicolor AM-OR11-026]
MVIEVTISTALLLDSVYYLLRPFCLIQMHFPWEKVLPKFIVLHMRCSTKYLSRQSNSTVIYQEGDGPIPSVIITTSPSPSTPISKLSPQPTVPVSREPGHEVSSNASSTQSYGRQASDMVQLSLPLLQAVSGAIPLAGPPMQAIINGLLIILQNIDRRSQNRADISSLKLRLNRLCWYICNAPTARDSGEQSRRDSLTRYTC